MKKFSWNILFASLALPLAASAQSEDWLQLNLALTDAFVQPAYDALAQTAGDLKTGAEAFCEAPDESGLASLREDFHQAMDAWQGIQHVKFGPITYFNWQYRLQYWPDDNGVGGRQLDALLAAADDSILELDAFARQSVGVQGFPALERLVFPGDALQQLQQNPYRCALVQTIAANIADIGDGLAARWRDEFRATVALEDDTGFFEDLQDASTDFVKALVETVPAIREQKLLPAMGESQAGFRERRAESWRSARSLRNIRVNIQALDAYYHGQDGLLAIEDVFVPEEAEAVSAAFEQVLGLLDEMPDAMAEQASTEAGYVQLQELSAAVDALYEHLEVAVKSTDLYLGFNSLDGD